MPDTPENRAEYPQHWGQKPGLGFPLARIVVLVCLATLGPDGPTGTFSDSAGPLPW